MSTLRARFLSPFLGPFLAGAIALTGFSSTAQATDVHLVPNRIFAGYTTYFGFNSGDILITANNTVNNPLVLPCYTTVFGSQVDLYYYQGIPTVFPQQFTQLMHLNGKIITTMGYSGTNFRDSITSNLSPMSPGQAQTDGQEVENYSNLATRDFSFQPKDLPVNETIRWRTTIRLFDDALYTHEIADSSPANNTTDIYIRHVCP